MVSKRHFELRKRQFRVIERPVRPLHITIMDVSELQEYRRARPRVMFGTNTTQNANQTATTSATTVGNPSESSTQASASTMSSPPRASVPSSQRWSTSSVRRVSSRQRTRKRDSPIERLCSAKAAYYSKMIKLQKEKLQFKREKLKHMLSIENQKIEILRERNRILQRYVENKLQIPIGLI